MTMGEGMVTVARKGAFASDLVFRKGHRFEGNYQTPYGVLSMGIYPTGGLFCQQGRRWRGQPALPAGHQGATPPSTSWTSPLKPRRRMAGLKAIQARLRAIVGPGLHPARYLPARLFASDARARMDAKTYENTARKLRKRVL